MTIPWIPFVWEGVEIDGRRFEKVGLFVKGELPELGLSGAFQFDLGAPNSVLYENNVLSEREKINAHIDPDRHIVVNGVECPMIDTPLVLNPQVALDQLGLFLGFGDGDVDVTSDGFPLLGTVGADVVNEKCLIIDFPQQRLAIVHEVPEEFVANAAIAPLQRTPSGHILLTFTVDGVDKRVLFDTGSSIFDLMTDKEQWLEITWGEVVDTLEILSWGQKQMVYGGVARGDFRLGHVALPLNTIYRIDDEGWAQFNRSHDLLGLMGNAPFLGSLIFLDLVRGRFGVTSSPGMNGAPN
jgi:hypothetical protein